MPFALILFGAIIAVAGIRNTYGVTQADGTPGLWGLVRNDFTTQGGFLVWVAAIAVLGAMGYVPKLRALSISLMTLVLLVLVISNKGIFARLQQFATTGADAQQTVTGVPNTSPNNSLPGTIGGFLNKALGSLGSLGNLGTLGDSQSLGPLAPSNVQGAEVLANLAAIAA